MMMLMRWMLRRLCHVNFHLFLTSSYIPEVNLGSAGEFQTRCSLELILRHAEDSVVRIRMALAGCDCRPARRRPGAGAGRRYRREHPLDLVIGYRHVALTYTKKATRADHNGFELSGSINNESFGNEHLLVVIRLD